MRKYIAASKGTEARNVVQAIAKNIASWYEREELDGLRANKKLFSIPAVPKAVPRGMKYQSSPDDWKAWRKIKFEMSAPQYYQYEVKAAKDGLSADIIARGDLNGDGKTSLFKLTVKIQSDHLVLAPSISEENPEE
jgi:hypothetical protein